MTRQERAQSVVNEIIKDRTNHIERLDPNLPTFEYHLLVTSYLNRLMAMYSEELTQAIAAQNKIK